MKGVEERYRSGIPHERPPNVFRRCFYIFSSGSTGGPGEYDAVQYIFFTASVFRALAGWLPMAGA